MFAHAASESVVSERMLRPALFAFGAAVAGTAVGFVAALAVALPIIHSDLASATNQMSQRLASVSSSRLAQADLTPEELATICGPQMEVPGQAPGVTSPSAVSPTPSVVTNQQVIPSQANAAAAASTNVFIKKLFAAAKVKTVASISNTGPHSENAITNNIVTKTNVTNNNNIQANVTNEQQASSGSAKVIDNTNAGSATTGDGTNNNSTSLDVNVANNATN